MSEPEWLEEARRLVKDKSRSINFHSLSIDLLNAVSEYRKQILVIRDEYFEGGDNTSAGWVEDIDETLNYNPLTEGDTNEL